MIKTFVNSPCVGLLHQALSVDKGDKHTPSFSSWEVLMVVSGCAKLGEHVENHL